MYILTPAPFVDGQIAAIAHVHGLVLVTTNDKDFARFKGLAVENRSRPGRMTTAICFSTADAV